VCLRVCLFGLYLQNPFPTFRFIVVFSRFGLCDASLWYKQCELNNRLFTVWFISFGRRLSLDTAAEALPQAVVVCVLKAS